MSQTYYIKGLIGKVLAYGGLQIRTSLPHGLQIPADKAKRAYENLTSGELNTGLCFANPELREAVIVVAKASEPSEFINSVSHENHHLASYIAKQFGLDPTGEEVAFLAGELMKEQFPYIKHLMCDCCRKKVYHERVHDEDRGYGVSEHGRLIPYLE